MKTTNNDPSPPNFPPLPNRVVGHSSMSYQNHQQAPKGSTAQQFIKGVDRFFEYIRKALGITTGNT